MLLFGQLQRVKAFLALHNVYGVDLNATAVELAEISLWLDNYHSINRVNIQPVWATRAGFHPY